MASALFEPLRLRGVVLPNRIGVTPMCQYSCGPDGLPTGWHLVHLGSRAVGGAGMVCAEATAVVPEGRISPYDTGLWSDEHVRAWRPITGFIAAQGAVPLVQLGHAGIKASSHRPWDPRTGGVGDADGGWQPVGPGDQPFAGGYRIPRALDADGIAGVVSAFAEAARRALEAGFAGVEVHAAHGYLLHEFLSPLTNRRDDGYGGSLDNRMRLAVEVTTAVREAVGDGVPVLVRVSATDWVEGGWTVDDTVVLARRLVGAGADLIDCSSGGAVPRANIPAAPGYQVPLAAAVRQRAGVPTAAVGLLTEPAQVERVIADGSADLALLGRQLLRDPYWPRRAATVLDAEPDWPPQYLRAF